VRLAPRHLDGAATKPDFETEAYAGAQVKAALVATVALGGESHVFWRRRDGTPGG
jgi:xylose isomerase